MNTKSFYNKTADKYDLRHNSPTTKWMRLREVKLIKKYAKGVIVDVGCGTGFHLKEGMVGIDISEEMVKIAKSMGKNAIIGSAEELKLGNESCNTILCLFTTLNLCDYEKAVKEFHRVLKSNGIAIISVASVWDKDKKPLLRRLFSDSDAQIKTMRIYGEKLKFSLFRKKEFVNLFEKNGFALKHFEGMFFLQKPRWNLFEEFTKYQKMKLKAEKYLQFLNKGSAMYFGVFVKK